MATSFSASEGGLPADQQVPFVENQAATAEDLARVAGEQATEAIRAQQYAEQMRQAAQQNADAAQQQHQAQAQNPGSSTLPTYDQLAAQVLHLTQQLTALGQQSAAAFQNVGQQTAQAQQTAHQAAATAASPVGSSSSVRVRIPQPQRFKGVREGPRILEWAHQATTYLRAANLHQTQEGVWHISTFLDGDAAVWWRLQCDKYERNIAVAPADWTEMKVLLIAQFQVFNHETDVKDRYTALRQQTTVSAYITRFRALVVELPEETEANQVYQFLKGLKPEIQARTRTHKPKTLLQAMDIADEADRANQHAYKGSVHSRHGSTSSGAWHHSAQRYDKDSRSTPQPMQIGAVQRGSPGPAELQRLRQENRCFYCRKNGHVARECPKKRADVSRRRPKPTRQSRPPAEN